MSFKEYVNKTTELGYFEGQIPVNYQYTLGIAGDTFFRNLMENGEFIASQCSECGVMTVYPLIYCEECFSPIDKYVPIGLEGELYSYTECYSDFQGNEYEAPHVMAMVRFRGVKGAVVHRLLIPVGDITLGMKVKAKLKDKKGRTGGIDDIVGFEKA